MIKITISRRASQLMKEIASQWFSFKKVMVIKERVIKLNDRTVKFFNEELEAWYPKEGDNFKCHLLNEKGETLNSFTPALLYDNIMNSSKWEGRAPTMVKIANTGYIYLHAFPEFKLRPFPGEQITLVIRALNGDEYRIPLIEKQA